MTHDIVLLGAGASMDAGLPSATRLAERLLRFIEQRESPSDTSTDSSWELGPNARALRGVIGAVQRHNAFLGADPFGPVDVERLFSAVQSLAKRDELEVAAFVGTWAPTHQPLPEHSDHSYPEPYLYEIIGGEMLEGLAQAGSAARIGDSRSV